MFGTAWAALQPLNETQDFVLLHQPLCNCEVNEHNDKEVDVIKPHRCFVVMCYFGYQNVLELECDEINKTCTPT